ncbi:MAG: hypothetical protein ABJC05_06245 [Pyrinomonadaceae bacterium]
MKHLVLLLLLFAPSLSFGQKPIEVSLPDGQKVLLKPDKTWDYVPSPAPNQPADRLRVEPLESLVALIKKSPEVFIQDESETQEQYFSKLRNYFNKTDLNGKKLKDTFFLLKTDFTYHAEEQEFTTTYDLFNTNYTIASRVNGVYAHAFPELSLKTPSDKATELKPHLRLAVNALPVGPVDSERVMILPVKYVIYDDRDNKILATIPTKNEIGH